MPESLEDERAVAATFPAAVPLDAHNQRLVENVHPLTWRDPEPKARYHLVVIGGGTGGLVTAAAAAGLGATVALIERQLMGGDCLTVGCVPSKAVIGAARAWQAARDARARFGGPAAHGAADFGAVMERMRRIRADLSRLDSAPRFRDLGVDVFLGDAQFVSPTAVAVNGKRLVFRRAVIATGARATAPPIPGLAETGYLTNETVFSLTELPVRFAVLGAGPVGCELAQAFARFGARVTVLDRGPRVLPRDDADAAAVVHRVLVRDGVTVVHEASITHVSRRGSATVVRYERGGLATELEVDALLVAVGRAPNVEGLGLEAAGVSHSRDGVTVDDRLRTTNARVYAVGDVCSHRKFTHVADFQARLVIQNALFFGRGRASRMVVPWTTYTSPELAQVGVTEQDAARAGIPIDTVRVPLSDVDRAVLDGEDDGFLKIVLRKNTDRILGATLVAEHAGDMISEMTLAITGGIGLGTVGRTIHPYPTQAEVFRKAADAWRRRKLTPTAKRALAAFFRIFR